ncbi:MAG: hypothetical protein ACK4OO_02025 [bacterium]
MKPLIVFLSVISFHQTIAFPVKFTNRAELGAFLPIGEEGKLWEIGYGISYQLLNADLKEKMILNWRLGFRRAIPNGENLLNERDMKFTVTKKEGWVVVGESWWAVNPLLIALPKQSFPLNWELGPSLIYCQRSSVAVKGFYSQGLAAVGKEIYREKEREWGLGVTTALSFPLNPNVKIFFSYSYSPLTFLPSWGVAGLNLQL